MEDLVGKPASFEVVGVVKSLSIEEESDVVQNGRMEVLSRTSNLRKRVVIETLDGGEVIVNTIGPVKILPLAD